MFSCTQSSSARPGRGHCKGTQTAELLAASVNARSPTVARNCSPWSGEHPSCNPAKAGVSTQPSARRVVSVQPKCPRRRSPPSTRSARTTRKSRGTSAPSSPPRRPPPRPSPRRRPARRPRRRCRRARRSRRRRRSVYTICRPRRRRRRRSDHRPRLIHRARRPRSPRRRPRPRRARRRPKKKLSRKERKKREDAAKKAAAAALAKKTTREAREARERRYRREIDDARRSLVEQKEMWLGLVKDSEQQCRDLELEVAEVRRDEAALSAQFDQTTSGGRERRRSAVELFPRRASSSR